MRFRIRRDQGGFSLIELSLATALFSMGLSGLSMLMLTANQGTADARHQTVAAVQASSLAEMIMMNSGAVGHYIHPPLVEGVGCLEEFCSAEDMAGENMGFWQSQLYRGLPGGSGLLCRDSTPDDGNADDPSCDGVGGVVIKIFWHEPYRRNGEESGRVRFVSRLPW